MFVLRLVLLLAFVVMNTNGDAYADFITRVRSLGVSFNAATIQKILNCTEPTIYKGGNSTAAANQVKNCILSFCISSYSTCAPVITAMNNCDSCLKPQSEKTTDLIDKLIPFAMPMIQSLYNNMTQIVSQGKSKGLTEYNTMLGAYTYGNKTLTRALADQVCQGLLPHMTSLEKNCTLKYVGALVNITGYACTTKMG